LDAKKAIIVICVVVGVVALSLFIYTRMRQSSDIHEKIHELSRKYGGSWDIRYGDWEAWVWQREQRFRAGFRPFSYIQMNNWTEFDESVGQNLGLFSSFYVDETHKIIWYFLPNATAVYLNYG